MATNYDSSKYGKLLIDTLPGAIESEEENERVLAVIERLMRRGEGNLSPEEDRLLRIALLFGLSVVGAQPPKAEMGPHNERDAYRSILLNAGFIFESVLLLKDLANRYGSDPAFSDVAKLLADRSRWVVIQKLRDRVGFHLDKDDLVTTKTLSAIQAGENFDLFSAEGIQRGSFALDKYYFCFADEIDNEFYLAEFGQPGRSTKRQVSEYIILDLTNLTIELVRAMKYFHFSLLDRLKLGLAPFDLKPQPSE